MNKSKSLINLKREKNSSSLLMFFSFKREWNASTKTIQENPNIFEFPNFVKIFLKLLLVLLLDLEGFEVWFCSIDQRQHYKFQRMFHGNLKIN
jgi:hypothetical protein